MEGDRFSSFLYFFPSYSLRLCCCCFVVFLLLFLLHLLFPRRLACRCGLKHNHHAITDPLGGESCVAE